MNDKKNSKQVLIANGIVRKDGKFLLVKRQREWDEQAHGKWEIPGGKVDFGEEPKETALREVEEETGYKVKNPKLLKSIYSHVWEYNTRRSHVVIFPFICELEGGEKNVSDKNVQEVEWLTRDEVDDLDCLPGTMKMLDLID